jgi:hypothetical protein
MPGDEDAQRFRQQSFLLGDFLERVRYRSPALERKALVHGHCHQKALAGIKAEQSLLARMGLDAEVLDSGCCGLAGSFGYEENHYEVSMKIGERVLLPRVRSAEKSTRPRQPLVALRDRLSLALRRSGHGRRRGRLRYRTRDHTSSHKHHYRV